MKPTDCTQNLHTRYDQEWGDSVNCFDWSQTKCSTTMIGTLTHELLQSTMIYNEKL